MVFGKIAIFAGALVGFTVGDEVFEATAEIVRNSGKPVLLYALE